MRGLRGGPSIPSAWLSRSRANWRWQVRGRLASIPACDLAALGALRTRRCTGGEVSLSGSGPEACRRYRRWSVAKWISKSAHVVGRLAWLLVPRSAGGGRGGRAAQ
eukprot:3825257-Prymnesium_polylepis.1